MILYNSKLEDRSTPPFLHLNYYYSYNYTNYNKKHSLCNILLLHIQAIYPSQSDIAQG